MNRSFIRLATSLLCGIVIAGALVTGCAKRTSQTPAASTSASSQQGAGAGNSAMTAFREEHKYTFQLTSMMGGIGRLEQDTKAPLTPAQAKSILAVINPLKTQATLTQDQAKEAMRGIKEVLTEKQLTEIAKPQRQFGRGNGAGGGGGAPGGGGPGGGGPGGGAPGAGAQGGGRAPGAGGGNRPAFDPEAMKNFNPFNQKASVPSMGRGGNRLQRTIDALEKKAQGK